MNCKEAQALITPYIEDELPPHETLQFISHVRGCPSCFDELEIYFTIYNTLRPAEVKGSYDMGKRIREDMDSREKQLRRWKAGKVYIAAGAVLMVVIGTILFIVGVSPGLALRLFLRLRSVLLKLMGL